MNDGMQAEYRRDHLEDSIRLLSVIDRKIDGTPGEGFSVADLGWLRAMVLDSIETDEEALGIEHGQTEESVRRTIRLGVAAGIKGARDAVLTPTDSPANPSHAVWQLHCPACHDPCVEQMGPGGDHDAVTVHPDRDVYDSPLGTRGGYVQIKLFCPSGHGFDLVIANHKGLEFIGVIDAGSRDYEGDHS